MARISFNAAFKEARDSGAKTFEWNGKSYSTKMAGEGGKKSVPMPPQRDEMPPVREDRAVERGADLEDLTPRKAPPVPRAMSKAEDIDNLMAVGRKVADALTQKNMARKAEPGVRMTDEDLAMKRMLDGQTEVAQYKKGGMVKRSAPKAKTKAKAAPARKPAAKSNARRARKGR